jgi:hypothetical protein
MTNQNQKEKKPRKISYTFYVEEDQLNRIRAIRNSRKIPTAVIMREGLEMALQKYESSDE